MSDTTDEIRRHYRSVRDVYAELATVGDNPTLLKNDHTGWYIKRDNDNVEQLENGWVKRARVATIDDYETVAGRADRTLYAITTYKSPEAVTEERPCRYNDDKQATEWKDGKTPTPGWCDVVALPAWGDVDLADDLKGERDSLDVDVQETIERTLSAYIDEYAELYDTDRAAISALDSVGGSYIFGPPEATLPVARVFKDDTDARGRVFEELNDRMNAYLREAEQRVNERVSGASELVHPDWCNNANRAYKAPLSVHSSHDAVVTPIDVENVQYTYTPLEAVDDDLLEECVEWSEQFTAVEHTELAEGLISTLWPEYVSRFGDWREALEEWVNDEREREEERRRRRQEAEQERSERLDDLGLSVTGQAVTPHMADVYSALDRVDTASIVRRYASDAWDTRPGSQPNIVRFDPSWRQSSSGSSCYVDENANTFGDPGDGGGGYAPKAIALGKRIITDASEDLSGDRWAEAVDALRDAGERIPVWIPGKGSKKRDGTEYDETPHWAIVKAAVTLQVCTKDELEEREASDGTTYPALPDKETFNATLDALEENGIEHGRRYAATEDRIERGAVEWDQIKAMYANPDYANKYARHAAVIKLLTENDYATTRDTEEVHSYYEPEGVFERGGERDIEHTLQRELGAHYSQHERNEIIGHIRARTYIDRDEFNAKDFDQDLVCLGNGVLNIETGELLEHSPEYLFTRSVPHDLPPVDLDDAGTDEIGSECPAIDAFLDDITQREADKHTLYEFIGHALLPHYDYKALLVLFGPGDNGKTTFYKVVEDLLGGKENISAAEMQELSENKFRAETVIGNFANISAEMNARKIDDMGMIKKMSGGDTFQVEPKGSRAYETENTATLMFGCNEPPVLPERGRKIATRLYPIELPYEFKSNPDPENPLEKQGRPQTELLEEITTESEMQGLLAEAVKGAQRLVETNGEFSMPETAEERMELYEQHSDPIKQFAVKCLDNEQSARVTKDDVYNVYVEFCRENDTKVASRNVFFRELRQTTFSYSETRPWGDSDGGNRHTYLENAKLTPHAKQFTDGVLFEFDEEEAADVDDETTDEEPALASLEPGYQNTFTATAADVSEGEYNRTAQGMLKGTRGTYIGFVVPGDSHNPLEGKQGKTFHFENVTLRTNDDNLLEAVINDATTVTSVPRAGNRNDADKQTAATDGSGQTLTADETDESAAGDGAGSDTPEDTRNADGDESDDDPTALEEPPADADSPLANARRLRVILEEKGRMKKADLFGKAADRYGVSMPDAIHALEKAQKEGLIEPKGGDEYTSV